MNVPQERHWEVWDQPWVAASIDAYWTSSDDEKAHRDRLAALVLGEVGNRSRDTVLEVGCGTGLMYRAISRRASRIRYVGIDNSPSMLEIANKRYRKPLLTIGDAYALSFDNGAFDVAFAFEVFGHMPDCHQPMAELYRVAKKAMLFTVWAAEIDTIRPMGDGRYLYPLSLIREWLSLIITGSDSVEEKGLPFGIFCFTVRKGSV